MGEGQGSAGPVSRRVAFAGAAAAAVGAAQVVRAGDAEAAVQNWSTAGNSVDAGSYVGTKNVQPLIFKTAATANAPAERMRIAAAGNVSIGTTSVGGNLNVGTTSGKIGARVYNTTTNGTGAGIYVSSSSAPAWYSVNTAGNGLKVVHNGTDGSGAGILVNSATATGINVSLSSAGTAIYAKTSDGTGVVGLGTVDGVNGNAPGTLGYGGNFSGGSIGAYGSGPTGLYGWGTNTGVSANGSTNGVSAYGGSFGVTASVGSNGTAVYGSGGLNSVLGSGGSNSGVRGASPYVGVWGTTSGNNGWGLFGESLGSGGYGVYGYSSTGGYGVFCDGNLNVTGTLYKAAGSFRIDHPLDPANKWLSHSFVESPDMMNVYNGNVTLDSSGYATVTLPSYFHVLNKEYRYQLTCIGDLARVCVKSKIDASGRFTIMGDKPGLKVSWQVTGIRQDDYAKAHPIVVEAAKTGAEKGTLQFVPKGSSAKAMSVAPKASAKLAEPTPPEVPKASTAPKPAIGQDWVAPKN